ncbi:hypothetical protein QFC19_004240 [Naganishia cerealis]|uniref:Uncharacterized protein n=1 Tax=Naganishia cerealis TaxID=610337 RepID=A0ACC2VXR7_9TREE|nr:hypothetical protein QFC19_004240 [Naganishia cerealis]
MSRYYCRAGSAPGTPTRMEMRHVIDMTQVDSDDGSAGGDEVELDIKEETEVGRLAFCIETTFLSLQITYPSLALPTFTPKPQLYVCPPSQRQVLPGDLLHALATLETFRRMADAGIDGQWGLAAGMIRHMANLNSVEQLPTHQRGGQLNGNQETEMTADVEVNMDGRVPARATFRKGEAMYDVSSCATLSRSYHRHPDCRILFACLPAQISIEPLAEWLSSLTSPDILEKVKLILEKTATPYDYFRIDERINEEYRHPTNDSFIIPSRSRIATQRFHCQAVPDVPIVRELRIDITTLHPAAIYRLEQMRRRQLQHRPIPMKIDVWVEEKEREWVKQRTKEKRVAQKLAKEKERQRLLLEQEKERQRLKEEKQKRMEDTVRRHLGMSTDRRSGKRNNDDAASDRSSEMSPVPSNISSPSPPPPQIFHEVQESVPFPFLPSSPPASTSQSLMAPPSRQAPAPPTANPHSGKSTGSSSVPSSVIDLTAPDEVTAASSRRVRKIKLTGASLSVRKSNDPGPTSALCSPNVGSPMASHQSTPKTGWPHTTLIPEQPPVNPPPNGTVTSSTGHSRYQRPAPILCQASLAEMGSPAGGEMLSKHAETHKGTLGVSDSNSPKKTKSTTEVQVDKSRLDLQSSTSGEVIEKMGMILTDQQAAVTSAGRHNTSAANVVIDLTLALDDDEVDVLPLSKSAKRRNGTAFPSRARRKADTPDDSRPTYMNHSQSQQQDEEDEDQVEALDILGEAYPDDSTDIDGTIRVDTASPAFSEEPRHSIGKASARSREIIVIDDDEDDVDTGHKGPAEPPASTSHSVSQSFPHAAISVKAVSSVNGASTSFAAGDTGSKASPNVVISRQEDVDMVIDDELEPVSVADTRSWELNRDLQQTHALRSPNKGKERTPNYKGKSRADALNLTLETPSSDRTQVDQQQKYGTSATVNQERATTGQTAANTESTDTDTPSRSPATGPRLGQQKIQKVRIEATLSASIRVSGIVSSTPLASSSTSIPAPTPPAAPAPASAPIRASGPPKHHALFALSNPPTNTTMSDVISSLPGPSTSIETTLQPVASSTQSVTNSTRSSFERQRQSEAFYAALASSFLKRCGAAPNLPNMYDAGKNSQMRHHPPGLWYNPSEARPPSSSTPPDHYLVQHRAISTTCDPRDVFGQIKTEGFADTLASKPKHQDADTSSDVETHHLREEGIAEHDLSTALDDNGIELSPVEAPTIEALVTQTPLAARNSQQAEASNRIEIQGKFHITLFKPTLADIAIHVAAETTWYKQGRATRGGKRKNYAEIPPAPLPPKRQRVSRTARSERNRTYEVFDDEDVFDDDADPIWVSGQSLRYGETEVEVCIPIRSDPWALTPPPRIPRPNLKIILNVQSRA